MAEQQFIMTQKGYDEAVARLKYLQTDKRDEIVARISEARSHGDLSENAEYDAARNEQAANEGEILELEYKLKNRQIYAVPENPEFVTFGVKVTVYDEDFEEHIARYEGVLEEKFNFVLNSNPKILKTSSKQNYGKIYAEYRNKLAHGTINPLGDNEIEVYRLLRAMIYILLLDDIKLDEKILSKIIKKVFL